MSKKVFPVGKYIFSSLKIYISFLLLSFYITKSTAFNYDMSTDKEFVGLREKVQEYLITQMNSEWGWDNGNTPRAVIAMALSNDTWFTCHDVTSHLVGKQVQLELAGLLLRRHKHVITSGQLALYINALLSICHDPHNFFEFDLVNKIKHLPVMSAYEQALKSLTLCNAGHHLSKQRLQALSSMLDSESNSFHDGLDTQAMAALALSCVDEYFQDSYLNKILYEPLKRFKKLQKSDGSFGNIYTTALIIQALIAANDDGDGWKMERALNYIKSQYEDLNVQSHVLSHFFVLPLLNTKSLIDLRRRDCNCYNATMKDNQTRKHWENEVLLIGLDNDGSPSFDLNENANSLNTTLGNTIIYSLRTSTEVNYSKNMDITIIVHASEEDTFLDVMEKAANADRRFQFTLKNTTVGPYVDSLSGINNDVSSKTYWMIYKSEKPDNELKLQDKGVSSIKPKHQDHFIFWYKSI